MSKKKHMTREELEKLGYTITSDGLAVKIQPKPASKLMTNISPTIVEENMKFREFISSLLNVDYYDIPVRANPKPRMTRSDKWKKRPVVVSYHNYKDALKAELQKINYKQENILAATFFYEMPQSWSKKKKDDWFLKEYNTKPDVDNSIKAFLDGQDIEDKFVYAVCVMQLWHHKSFIRIYIPRKK